MYTSHRGRFPNDLTNRVAREGCNPVASGGFADIYRGMLQRDDADSIKVAIKAIKTYSGEDVNLSKKQKRLRREIKVWLNLRHDNVLPLLGTTLGFGKFPAMVCPWVENGSLTVYLENQYQYLPVIEILNLLNDVASGLHYLHSQFVVHGDLSGSNVLIRENGVAYIADFGLSMLLTELGGSTFATSFHARGTLRWIAPELLDLEVPEDDMEEESSRAAPTTQSDVYSFGSIMLQILSGRVPYHYYKREAQVLHAISKGKTPGRPDCALITEGRWIFIQQCWTIVEILGMRPSSEEIVKFTEEELAAYEEWDDARSDIQFPLGASIDQALMVFELAPPIRTFENQLISAAASSSIAHRQHPHPFHEHRISSSLPEPDEPETIHPLPFRNSLPIVSTKPARAPIDDGWIPVADSRTLRITLPPPHELLPSDIPSFNPDPSWSRNGLVRSRTQKTTSTGRTAPTTGIYEARAYRAPLVRQPTLHSYKESDRGKERDKNRDRDKEKMRATAVVRRARDWDGDGALVQVTKEARPVEDLTPPRAPRRRPISLFDSEEE